MVDDKSIKMGTDDDFQFNYTNGLTDTSYITSTTASQLFLSSDVQRLNASNHTDKYFYGNSTNTIVIS